MNCRSKSLWRSPARGVLHGSHFPPTVKNRPTKPHHGAGARAKREPPVSPPPFQAIGRSARVPVTLLPLHWIGSEVRLGFFFESFPKKTVFEFVECAFDDFLLAGRFQAKRQFADALSGRRRNADGTARTAPHFHSVTHASTACQPAVRSIRSGCHGDPRRRAGHPGTLCQTGGRDGPAGVSPRLTFVTLPA